MVLKLTLPESGNKKRIKDVVIDVLSFNWPLSFSQIHRKIKKDYNYSCSSQATYKAILELQNDGVLTKIEKQYCINLNWIDKIRKFSENIEKNYHGKNKISLVDGISNISTSNNVTVMTFDSLLELDKAWLDIKCQFYKQADKKQKEITFCQANHCWWLLVYPEYEYRELEYLKTKNVRDFVIVHQNTKLDNHAKKFYNNLGIPFKTLNSPLDSDLTVFGDKIMQVTIPKDLRDEIDFVYKNYSKPGEVSVAEFIKKIVGKKRKIELSLIKNKEIADQLKIKVMNEFNQIKSRDLIN